MGDGRYAPFRHPQPVACGRIKFGVTPEINAISTIVVAITAIVVAITAIVLFVAWRLGAFRGGGRTLVTPEQPG